MTRIYHITKFSDSSSYIFFMDVTGTAIFAYLKNTGLIFTGL